ncbi:MAG: BamA/TamA family outer membrane protein [Chitinispirillia bacterium]|nr:BamA/TamA family outer membrane protein [Chitinispirillia bacterium]MCL2241239.1 BamA/TamA family outer membrane protein [Chitinispirillia bacterium]
MHLRLTLISLCLLLCGLASANTDTAASSSASPAVRIAAIEIHGNRITRPETLRHFFAFDKGEPVDTAKIRTTRANLLATKLFAKVDILQHMREDGIHIIIILKEAVRLQLAYGGGYSTVKYGLDDLWFSFNFNVGLENFRGRMEELWLGTGFWDRRSLDISWYKPFLSTPYFAALSAGVTQYPEYILPIDNTDVYVRAAAGRTFGDYSRLSISAIPVYRHRDIVEWVPDSASRIPESYKREIYEAYASVSYSYDRRSARFAPTSGWYYAAQLRTNLLHPGGFTPFFQLSNEFRSYWSPGGGDVASMRLLLTLRDREAGKYHRLAYGSHGEIRGYSDDELGWQFETNSSLLAALKYHKLLYKTPRVPFPLVNTFFVGAGDISFRFDATFLVDYALLARDNLGVLTLSGPWQDGMGIGFGTRIMVPEIRQSGCIDLVFGRIDDSEGSRWEPAVHIYLDMFF